MIRHRDVALSPEEAARFDEDQRENLRSWGIGVPEPTYPPDPDEPPISPYIVYNVQQQQPNYPVFSSGLPPGPITFTAINPTYFSRNTQWLSHSVLSDIGMVSGVDYAQQPTRIPRIK